MFYSRRSFSEIPRHTQHIQCSLSDSRKWNLSQSILECFEWALQYRKMCCTQLSYTMGLHQVYNRNLQSIQSISRFLGSYSEDMSNQNQCHLKANWLNSAHLLWKCHRISHKSNPTLCFKKNVYMKNAFSFSSSSRKEKVFVKREVSVVKRFYKGFHSHICELLKIIFQVNDILVLALSNLKMESLSTLFITRITRMQIKYIY